MGKNKTIKRVFIFLLFILLVAAGLSCSAIDRKKKNKETGMTFNIGQKIKQGEHKDENPPPLYYDFKDILIPGELTEDRKHSSVIGTGDSATGFQAFYGRLEFRSLVHFFQVKVPEDGWELISVIKSPFSTNMIFHKGKRWCLISLEEKGFTTEVGVGVSSEL